MRTLLACLILSGVAQGQARDPRVGVKVVTKYAMPLKIENRVVDDGATFRVYTVDQAGGGYLWLVAGEVKGRIPASDVVPFADAIGFYTDEIRGNPGNSAPYIWRGLFLKEEGRLDAAIADFTEAIRLSPHNARAFTNRGNVWQAKDDFDHAIADYTEAMRIDPKGAWATNNRGHARGKKKDYDRAFADYTEAIRLDPKGADPYNNRAWEWATCPDPKFRDGKKAVESAKKACELSAWKDANSVGTLAASHAEAGDFDQAVKWELEAIKLPASDDRERKGRRDRLALYRDKKPYRRP